MSDNFLKPDIEVRNDGTSEPVDLDSFVKWLDTEVCETHEQIDKIVHLIEASQAELRAARETIAKQNTFADMHRVHREKLEGKIAEKDAEIERLRVESECLGLRKRIAELERERCVAIVKARLCQNKDILDALREGE